MCVCAQLLRRVRLFVTPWTVAHLAPLAMRFSRQDYWSGVPYPPPGDLPNPRIEPTSPALQAGSLPPSHRESPQNGNTHHQAQNLSHPPPGGTFLSFRPTSLISSSFNSSNRPSPFHRANPNWVRQRRDCVSSRPRQTKRPKKAGSTKSRKNHKGSAAPCGKLTSVNFLLQDKP